jgi:hypothetical protein
MGKVQENRIVLKMVRVSYCYLVDPKPILDKKTNEKVGEQWSCQLLISKLGKFAKENELAIDKAIKYVKENEKSKLVNKNGIVPSNLPVMKRDGDTDPTYEGNEIYKDNWVVNCTNKLQQPGLVDRNRQPIMNKDEIYSGMWVYASVTYRAYDNDGKGICAFINNIMKIKDGDRLDGAISAEKEFETFDDIPDDEDETI